MINSRTAYILFAALAALALLLLKGKFLAFALIVVLAFAGKTYVDDLRRRL